MDPNLAMGFPGECSPDSTMRTVNIFFDYHSLHEVLEGDMEHDWCDVFDAVKDNSTQLPFVT